MKTLINLFFALILVVSHTFGQSIPTGMNYQAVLRHADGQLISDQNVTIKIDLLAGVEGRVTYSEIHHLASDKYGLVTTIIGQGESVYAAFDQVPWANGNIWMRVAMDARNTGDFQTLTENQLLSVPYAMHAASADKVQSASSENRSLGLKFESWKITGNNVLDPDKHFLGSRTPSDVVVKTHNEERMRIDAKGRIYMRGDVFLDENLKVISHTVLNTLDVVSDAHVFGDMTTDGDMLTKGSSTVEGDATIVGNSTTFGNAAIKGNLIAEGSFEVQGESNLSKLKISETLDVQGATSLADLYVADDATISENLKVDGHLAIGTDPDENYKLVVKGDDPEYLVLFQNENNVSGDGIAIQIGQSTTGAKNNFVSFMDGSGHMTGRIEGYKYGAEEEEEEEEAGFALPSDDAIKEYVCLYANRSLEVKALNYLVDGVNFIGDGWNGIKFPGAPMPDVPKIKIPEIELFGGLGMPAGIPNVPSIDFPETQIFPGLTIPDIPEIPFKDIVEIPTLADINEITEDLLGCNEYDSNADIEDLYPALFDWYRGYVEWNMRIGGEAAGFIESMSLGSKTQLWEVEKQSKDGGVTYGSKGADYAEYLPKLNDNEAFMPGDVVGIFGGEISKNTVGADQVLAISSMPIVLGNQPKVGSEADYEKVGFLGQVPVFVMGLVEVGDYIIPSGKNDGIAVAVAAHDIQLDMINNVIGKAWSSSRTAGLELINVSIGMRPSEFVPILQKQNERMDALEAKVNLLVH